jgi:KDO2-lipid IV(A) lauroyltransferase
LVYPHWSPKRVNRFTREIFGHCGLTLVEMAHVSGLTRAQCRQYIHVEGKHHLSSAIDGKRGAIIISAHLGNWEAGLMLYPLLAEMPLLSIAKPIKAPFANRWFMQFRTRFGNVVVPKKNVFGLMLNTLRQGDSVGLMMDVARWKQNVPVRFMGYRTTVSAASALLALRSRSPVIPVFCLRGADGRLTVRVEPPVPIRRTSDLPNDLHYNSQRMTSIIERAVRQNPEQWLWMMKRWKSYSPELYADCFLGRELIKI